MVSAIRCNCAVLGGGRLELTDFGAAQVQSRQVDQGTQAGKVCTEKGASVGAGVRYSNICIDRLGGQGFKLMISRIYNWGCDANEDNRTNPYLPVISFGTPLISMTALKSRCLRRSHTSKFSDMATEKRQKNFPGESSGTLGPSSTPPPLCHNKLENKEAALFNFH